jgi:TatD DNase family protein
MKYFDAHTHAHFAAFADDYRAVIRRALDAGVGMINVGTQRDTSRRAVEVAHEFERESVYAAVGLHPIHTEKSYHDAKELGGDAAAEDFTSRGENFDYDYYQNLARDPKVVAIGECGLDYYRLGEDTKKKQRETLAGQIELSRNTKKPLMIHCRETLNPLKGRNAFHDLISLLREYRESLIDPPGVIHFFTGTKDDALALLDLGFAFTFGGVITFARDYDEAIRAIPVDRLLSETDAPYVSPAPYRGRRNEPAYVVEVVKKLAELKEVPRDAMAEKILENSKRIFLAS